MDMNGARILPEYLSVEKQRQMVAELRKIAEQAPLVQHETRSGRKLSVRMTAAGAYGWVSDRRGYRYERTQPDGRIWPHIPEMFLQLWADVANCPRSPQCCLINYYGEGARMGLHQDKDEVDFSCPVVSVSLGDDGLFRIKGTQRGGATKSVWLRSGDVLILGGPARLANHGVDRIRFASSSLLPNHGRINITMRVVD